MKSSTNTSWIDRLSVEYREAARRVAAQTFAALAMVLALPAQAFQRTSFDDGRFEYFFAAPALEIRGSGGLDLTGLSFIEAVEGGFRVGASLNLDWLRGERAWQASPAGTWTGLDMVPRLLSIVAGDKLARGPARLTVSGGTISLTAGGALAIADGSALNGGGSVGQVIGIPRGGTLLIRPGGGITLNGTSPIPEPDTAILLLTGLGGLAGFVRRRRAGR